MTSYHTKAVKDYITRLNRETFAQAPSKEILRKIARDPHYPQIGLNTIDRLTGEMVDYDTLQPYLEKHGYNINLAMKEYLETQNAV